MKKQPEGEQGLPEWIMSYADMITILMAFFVVMYSMAGSNKDAPREKEQQVMKSLRDRFGPNYLGIMGLWPKGETPKSGDIPLQDGSSGTKRNTDGETPANGARTIRSRADVATSNKLAPLGGILHFTQGEAALTRQHELQVQRAAEETAGKPQRIEIRGHVSRQPNASGSDKWDLAFARCRNTMNQLVKAGIDPRRIRLGVAADNEPLGGGEDALAVHQSSRVEIFLLDEMANLAGEAPRQAVGRGPENR